MSLLALLTMRDEGELSILTSRYQHILNVHASCNCNMHTYKYTAVFQEQSRIGSVPFGLKSEKTDTLNTNVTTTRYTVSQNRNQNLESELKKKASKNGELLLLPKVPNMVTG
jgi:hypothetical protein